MGQDFELFLVEGLYLDLQRVQLGPVLVKGVLQI